MLTATVLALVAAVLHAVWNLSVKQSVGDRFIALWGQFFVAGWLAAVVLIIGGGIPARGFVWAAMSGLTHVEHVFERNHHHPQPRGVDRLFRST